MQEMLQKILELDLQERELIRQAEEQKTNTQKNIAEIKNALRQEYLDRARARIAKNAQQEQDEAEAQWQMIRTRHEQLRAGLDAIYAQKADQLAAQMTANILR